MAPPVSTSAPPRESVRRGGRGVIVLFAVVTAALAGWWWQAHLRPAPAPFPRDPELQRLHELIFGLDATMDDYAAAEATVRALAQQRPDDPEVAIVQSEVNNWYFLRGFDRSEVRLWDMGSHARRALQLAPDEPAAIAAMGEYLLARESELDRAAALLREAIALDPAVPRWQSSLAEVLRQSDPAAGLEVLRAAVARFPQDPLVRYNLARHYRDNGQLDEMERELDAVIAMKPIANALLWKARVQLWAHGDIDGMKASLDHVSPAMRISERAAVNLFVHAEVTGQPDEALAVLRALPSAWINDYDFAGPKGLLIGQLLARRGETEAARREFQNAYAEIARRRPLQSTDATLRVAELWTLIGLDRRDEARAAHNIQVSKVARPYRLGFFTSWWFSEIPTAVVLGDRDTAWQLLREAATTVDGRRQLRNALKVDPRMAALRDDPEIAALLVEPAAGTAQP